MTEIRCEICPTRGILVAPSLHHGGGILILGERPGADEAREGAPFIGASGRLLWSALRDVAGIEIGEWSVTNVVRCFNAGANPTAAETAACMEAHYAAELEVVQPRFILTLGSHALGAVRRKNGMMKWRGTYEVIDGATVYSTVHPAAVLRNPSLIATFKSDLTAFASLVNRRHSEPKLASHKIVTERNYDTFIRFLKQHGKCYAVDIETEGLGHPAQNMILTVAISDGTDSWVLPVWHIEACRSVFMSAVPELFRFLREQPTVYHNSRFDLAHLCHGLDAEPPKLEHDTLIYAYLEDERRGSHKLDEQVAIHFPDYIGWKQTVDHEHMADVPLAALAAYNATDALLTHKLMQKQRAQNDVAKLRLHGFLCRVSEVLRGMERRGVAIDIDYAIAGAAQCDTTKVVELARMKKITRDPLFNPASTKQVAEVLYEKMKLKPLKRSEATGAPSTDADVLERYHKHAFCDSLLKYRKADKYLGTYFEGFMSRARNGRLHTRYGLTATDTGRLSSSDPNTQNVPRDPFVKDLIVASDGNVLVALDHSQCELRTMAWASNDKVMIEMYQRGEDFHTATGEAFFGHKMSEEERTLIKGRNFSIAYGTSSEGLAARLGVRVREASAMIDDFFTRFPRFAQWVNEVHKELARTGEVRSLIGRMRHFANRESDHSKRAAVNALIQGLASDIMLWGMAVIDKALPGALVMNIHDSVVLDVPAAQAEDAAHIAKDTMEDVPSFAEYFGLTCPVPYVADVKVGRSLGAMKKI